MIYHITSRKAWRAAQEHGWYSAPSLQSEGFVHCSARQQILPVANDFYRNRRDLILLCIDENRIIAEVKWEAPAHPVASQASQTQNERTFPHIYGRLNLDAVVGALAFEETANGFALPPDLP